MPSIKSYLIFLSLIFNHQLLAEWHNWAGNQSCNPKKVWNPTTKEELISIIKEAAKAHHKVSVMGTGHSFSAIACSDDYMIDMTGLNTILSVDKNLLRVRAQGGIRIQDLNKAIAHYDLALSNLPAMGGMTLAGAVCTATHGTGHSGTLSSFITEIELISADGVVHVLSAQQNPELFKAACVSLGTLGVIYCVTMQCEPLFMLDYVQKTMSLDELLAQYRQLFQQSDYFQFRWQLRDDVVYADSWHRINVKVQPNSSLSLKTSYDALQWDTSTELGMACEIAVPLDLLPQAIAIIQKLVPQWTQNGFALEEVVCRFVCADKNSYLSPAADYDVVYLNIGTDAEAKYYEFFKAFEEAMYSLNGRPHWGKVNFLDHEKCNELYGENFIKFTEIKNHIDPFNIFSNTSINQILGL